MKRQIAFWLILHASFVVLQAQELTLGPLFTDHMVLQQGQPLPVWGTAPAGRKVSVTFGKTTMKATADKEGKWQVTLPRQAATFEGKPLAVSAGKEKLQLHDVVVGEVWVAAGQSNMEYTMKKYPAYQNPYKGNDLAAEELQKPENRNIRVYNCPRKGKGSAWQCANAESLAPASAPGYFCVKHLQDSLQVRYLWHETAQSTDLRNSLGLCAFPFCLKVKTAGRPTIYSIGDSTMSNRKAGTNEAGWGQMLPEHLTDAIRVDNHAQAGRSTKSFISEGRWQAVLNLLQPGDYVFIQFGHNDEKEDEARHTEPMTTFKDNLRRFITEAQDKGATPVLFNAMVRRKFGPDGKLQNTHGDYIRAPFEVAEEMAIPYVDAEQLSRQLVEQLGPEDSKQLFMWYPPKKKDDTHLNRKGALQMSKLFLDATAEVVPELKAYIK